MALLTVTRSMPSAQWSQEKLANPLGIFIDHYSWRRRTETENENVFNRGSVTCGHLRHCRSGSVQAEPKLLRAIPKQAQ